VTFKRVSLFIYLALRFGVLLFRFRFRNRSLVFWYYLDVLINPRDRAGLAMPGAAF